MSYNSDYRSFGPITPESWAESWGKSMEESTENVPGGGAPVSPPPAGDGSDGDGAAPHLDSSRTSHRTGDSSSATGGLTCPTTGREAEDSGEEEGDRPDECPNRWMLTRKKRLPSGGWNTTYIPMDCMRQGCPHCGPKLRRRKVAHFCRVFSELVEDGYRLLFTTFTVDPKLKRTDYCHGKARSLSTGLQEAFLKEQVWDKFWKRLRRRFDDYEYVGAMESHEDGRPHLHVMIALRDPEDRSWRELNALVREQWFESGGGAVMDVKEPRSRSRAAEGEDDGDMGEDGRPESMSGMLGYLAKYMEKSARERSGEQGCGRKPKVTLCSQGIGYNSKAAKLRRKAVARGIDDPTEEDLNRIAREEAEGSEVVYETPFDNEKERQFGSGGKSEAREYRREFFREHVTDEHVTQAYRTKVEDHPEYGRTVWEVYTYTDEGVRQEVYDRFPGDDRADLLDVFVPND